MSVPKPTLPYTLNALEPHMSARQLSLHFNQHHMGYYNNFCRLTAGMNVTPEQVILQNKQGELYNQAAQLYNHAFFWRCMKPNPNDEDREPVGELAKAISSTWSSVSQFKDVFSDHAKKHFGSGWVWLILNKETNKLEVRDGHDGYCILSEKNVIPIIVCDVWEHAYYIDRENRKADYVQAWWRLVDWESANTVFTKEIVYDYTSTQ